MEPMTAAAMLAALTTPIGSSQIEGALRLAEPVPVEQAMAEAFARAGSGTHVPQVRATDADCGKQGCRVKDSDKEEDNA